MGRLILFIYVLLNLIVVILNIITNTISDEAVHFLDKDSWLLFIIACGFLGIIEILEKSKSG